MTERHIIDAEFEDVPPTVAICAPCFGTVFGYAQLAVRTPAPAGTACVHCGRAGTHAPAPTHVLQADYDEAHPRAHRVQYGRRSVAGSSADHDPNGRGPTPTASTRPRLAVLLDAATQTATAVAGAAHAVGADDVAQRAQRAARLADGAAEVAHALPAAVDAVKSGTAPLRGALGRLWAKAQDEGVVGRREPKAVHRAPARPVASRKAKERT